MIAKLKRVGFWLTIVVVALTGLACHVGDDDDDDDNGGPFKVDPPGSVGGPLGQWSLTDLDDPLGDTFYYVGVVVDDLSVVNVLSAPEYSSPAIWTKTNGVWTKAATTDVNLVGPRGFRASDDGALHILGSSANDEDVLLYLTNQTAEWISEIVDSEGRAYTSALAVTAEGVPRVAFSPKLVEGEPREIYLTERTDDGWVAERLPVDNAAVVAGLEVDGQGHNFVHYLQDNGLYGSFVLTDRLGQWGKITVFGAPEPPGYEDVIVIDREGLVRLAAAEQADYGFAARIWATVEPFSFGDGSIVDEFADGPWMWNEIDLAVDYNLASHLVYGDFSLRYATNRWPSADWRISQIYDGDIWTLAVATDVDQYAHIAFSTPNGVKYATNRPAE